MSEESDKSDDPGTIVVHHLPWRSSGIEYILSLVIIVVVSSSDFNTFIHHLDERYDQKLKKQGMLMAKKVREVGTSSNQPPPPNAPRWSIRKTGRKVFLVYPCVYPLFFLGLGVSHTIFISVPVFVMM